MWLPEARHVEKGDWMKTVKEYELPVTRCICARDEMYNMTSIVNAAEHYILIC